MVTGGGGWFPSFEGGTMCRGERRVVIILLIPSDTLSPPSGRCQGVARPGLSRVFPLTFPRLPTMCRSTRGGGRVIAQHRRPQRDPRRLRGGGTISVGPGTCDGMDGIHVVGPLTHPTHSSAVVGGQSPSAHAESLPDDEPHRSRR